MRPVPRGRPAAWHSFCGICRVYGRQAPATVIPGMTKLYLPPMPGALSLDSAGCNRGVLAAAASGLSDFILAQGADVDRVFGISGIDPRQLESPTLSLALTRYCGVMEEASRQSGAGNFGLHFGIQFMPHALGLLGYIGLSSRTVGEAMRNVAEAFCYHQHDTFVQFINLGDCGRFDYQIRHRAIAQRRHDAELTMGMIVNLARHALGAGWGPREIHLEHHRPEQSQEHCRVFNAPVYFERPYNSVVIEAADLRQPMPDADPMLLMLLGNAIRQLNESGAPQQDLVDRARARIRARLAEGEPLIDDIAADLELSSWSLQKQLRAEQLNFTRLVGIVRKELATYYLQQSLPISEIALLLGYSEISAFSRAFRHWFGLSPNQWRREQGALRKA